MAYVNGMAYEWLKNQGGPRTLSEHLGLEESSTAQQLAENYGKYNDEINKTIQDDRDWHAKQAEIDRLFQQESASTAMDFASAEAEKNRAWQEQMRNTAMSSRVQDLKNAGLNPLLALSQPPAATPAGSTAQAHAAGGSRSASVSALGAITKLATTQQNNANKIQTAFIKSIGDVVGDIIHALK